MRRARIDDNGTLHCWRCGATSFTTKRTLVGKIGFGFLAPKHTRCMGCGAYSQTGRKPKRMKPAPAPMAPPQAGPPPGWYNDPNGQPVQRWWDGARWTEHTQSAGAPPPPPPP